MSTSHHDDAIRLKKDREVLLERFRGEILREAGNRSSLNQVKARVLHDAHVRADPVLAESLRAFIAQRESLLAHATPKPTQQHVERLPPRIHVANGCGELAAAEYEVSSAALPSTRTSSVPGSDFNDTIA